MVSALKVIRSSEKWLVRTKLLDAVLIQLSIFYLVLPTLIFAFGWMKPVIAGVFTVLVLFGWFQAFRNFEYRAITIHPRKIIFIIFVIVIISGWLLLSGVGEFGLQGWDFNGRNAIFHDLITHSWPVRYDYSGQPELQNLFGPSGALVYYFLFALPAALVGKIFGWQVANLALFFWSFGGLLLVVYLLARKIGRASLWMVAAFIFFSGMDIIFSQNIAGGSAASQASPPGGFPGILWREITGTSSVEWWANYLFQYSSITTQLYNVFNQAIPAWIVTLWILNQPQRKNDIFVYSLLALFAPFPFIGLFPFILYRSLAPGINGRMWLRKNTDQNIENKPSLFQFFRQNIALQNFFAGGIVILVSCTFLLSNTGAHENGFIWEFNPQTGSLILSYLLFCLVEFLILGLLIYKENSDKGLLILTLVVLSVIPLFKYGTWNDFAMRVSIPPLIILFVLMIKNIWVESPQKRNFKNFLLKSCIVTILLVGSITPLHEIHRSVNALIASQGRPVPQDMWLTFDYGGAADKMATLPNFVLSNPDSRLFFKLLGK